jgi:hypothetical protein
VNLLIFGFGTVANDRYLPNMLRAARETDPPLLLDWECVDNKRSRCVHVETWWRELGMKLEEVDKILILSPPSGHYPNLSSIADRYESQRCPFPEIYVEKPIYLESGRPEWTELLAKHPGLDGRASYIDHYRFKPALVWFEEHRRDMLRSIGRVRKIGFVSLEEQEFWDSEAFSAGYFLEHACHLVSMLDRVFPGLGSHGWTPRRTNDWRVWEQQGRPPSCKRDSACLFHMSLTRLNGPEFAPQAELTAVIGKGMIDAKVLYLEGERGHAQLWFNKGESVVAPTEGQPVKVKFPPGDSYGAVVDAILSPREDRRLLLSLRQGMAEQEKVIAISRHFPERAQTYNVGEIPDEISKELSGMSLNIA